MDAYATCYQFRLVSICAFQLTPGYRGYTIDSLKKLDFFDDVTVSADEKHHFKGISTKLGNNAVKTTYTKLLNDLYN